MVIATGADPVIPPFIRESSAKAIFPMWNYPEALEIRKRIKINKQVAIIGGGLNGTESALRAEDNDLDITLIEKMPHLLSRYFGKKASGVIEAQLRMRNITLMLNDRVSAIEESYNNMTMVDMENGGAFLCDFIVLTIGSRFDTSMAAEAGLQTGRQILVNEHLQTSSPGIFAAGDIAQFSQLRPCSAEEATQQGKIAGYNVLAYLNGKELQSYEEQPVPFYLKYKDFEVYSLGEVPEIGDKEKVLTFEAMKVYRGCVYEKSALAGVQMVGSNKDSMKYEKEFLLGKIWSKIKGTKVCWTV